MHCSSGKGYQPSYAARQREMKASFTKEFTNISSLVVPCSKQYQKGHGPSSFVSPELWMSTPYLDLPIPWSGSTTSHLKGGVCCRIETNPMQSKPTPQHNMPKMNGKNTTAIGVLLLDARRTHMYSPLLAIQNRWLAASSI